MFSNVKLIALICSIQDRKQKLTGATSGAGTVYPPGAPCVVHTRVLPGFVLLDFYVCVCFVGRCLSFCTFLSIVLSVLLRFTDSVISEIRVTRSLVLCVCFVDRCLSFCTFFLFFFLPLCCLSFYLRILNDCPLWYLKTLLIYRKQLKQREILPYSLQIIIII